MSEPLSAKVQTIKLVCQILAGSFFISGLAVLWKRFKGYLLFLLGFANLAFIFFVFGWGAYFYGYWDLEAPGFINRFFLGRVFAFPWGFLGVLGAVLLLYLLPKKIGKLGILLGASIFLIALGAVQPLIWPSIHHHYGVAKKAWGPGEDAARLVGEYYTGKGAVVIGAGGPDLTYSLVYYEGISGEKLISAFYDPFYYYKGEDPFAEWETFREEIAAWLQKHSAELLVVDKKSEKGSGEYSRMLELEKDKLFEFIDETDYYEVYRVKVDEDVSRKGEGLLGVEIPRGMMAKSKR